MFDLTSDGLKPIEITPGVDLDRDLPRLINARAIMDGVQLMDPHIFPEEEMDLRTDLFHLDLPNRVAIESKLDQLFLNFKKTARPGA